jgi:hypothetical protein
MGQLEWSLSARAAAQLEPIAQKHSTCGRSSSEPQRARLDIGSPVPAARRIVPASMFPRQRCQQLYSVKILGLKLNFARFIEHISTRNGDTMPNL